MGERQSDGGLSGRGSRHALLDADVEALIVASLIRDGVDAEAEQRAVAAFRAARDAGAPRTRTRRRDDWRARERRYLGRSLKTTLSVLLASLTLGGVAVAAIGVAGTPQDGTDNAPERGPAPSNAPRYPSEQPSRDGHSPAPGTGPSPDLPSPDRPSPAQDTEAHCRAYERVGRRGKAMEATSWQRLVAAAGGERYITAYCAEQLDEPERGSGESGNGRSAKDDGTPAARGGTGNASENGSDKGSNSGSDKNRGESKRSQPNGRHQ
ncbi:hypothetical protein SAMN06272771_4917 [Streptomyces sp. Ag82_O1-12]|uniref:hypothetical protein n=1 Tax=unclassified Streptomyces TaxID=2593676 RepID=UPI000BDD2365|nr:MULTISPECIES: hypothetical protein [unclassified Streptomyces]SMQ18464.1 hypothetical protein SAMN06272771_4917 [Streptomyces sp. Ag82_O1-12]SOD47502.1 hypothetical protein SAMN06272727_4918 [Streptomyces sp. Ag82_G6-1]